MGPLALNGNEATFVKVMFSAIPSPEPMVFQLTDTPHMQGSDFQMPC